MDLAQFALGNGVNHTDEVKRKFALDFLSSFADDADIKAEVWPGLIEFAEQFYYATDSYDSGYMPGGMDFSAIEGFEEDLKRRILNHFYFSGYWIIQDHVRDYCQENKVDLGLCL